MSDIQFPLLNQAHRLFGGGDTSPEFLWKLPQLLYVSLEQVSNILRVHKLAPFGHNVLSAVPQNKTGDRRLLLESLPPFSAVNVLQYMEYLDTDV